MAVNRVDIMSVNSESNLNVIRENRCEAVLFADRIGYIPLVGNVLGLARIIASLVLGIITGIASATVFVFNRSGYQDNIWVYRFNRCMDEFHRGVYEFFPLDLMSRKTYDELLLGAEEDTGTVTRCNGAYGNFAYRYGAKVHYGFLEHSEIVQIGPYSIDFKKEVKLNPQEEFLF